MCNLLPAELSICKPFASCIGRANECRAEKEARQRGRLYADRDAGSARLDGPRAFCLGQHYLAMAAKLESGGRPHPAQRIDRAGIAADPRPPCSRLVCPSKSQPAAAA